MNKTIVCPGSASSMKIIPWVFFTMIFILYFSYSFSSSENYTNIEPETESNAIPFDYTNRAMIHNESGYIKVKNEELYITDMKNEAELFTLVPGNKDNVVSIMSNSNRKYLSIDYSSTNPLRKGVIFKNTKSVLEDNSLKIKLIFVNKKKKYIAKFFNGDYLCEINGYFYGSRLDKKNIFYFSHTL